MPASGEIVTDGFGSSRFATVLGCFNVTEGWSSWSSSGIALVEVVGLSSSFCFR